MVLSVPTLDEDSGQTTIRTRQWPKPHDPRTCGSLLPRFGRAARTFRELSASNTMNRTQMRVAITRVLLLIVVLRVQALDGAEGQAMAAVPSGDSDAAARDDRSDRTEDQESAIDALNSAAQNRKLTAPSVPRPFTFRLNAPLYYNSNANEIPTRAPAALEGNPQMELGWRRTLIPLQFSVRLGADADRYVAVPEAQEDQTYGSLKVAYYDPGNDQAWAPFVSYKNTLIFSATFAPWTETRNDFALGIDKFFSFDRGFHELPASGRSRVDAVWVLGMGTYVQRRLRTPGPDSVAVYFVPSVMFVPTKEWSVSVFVNARERWFDSVPSGATTISRQDSEINPILTIAYEPSDPLSGGKALAQFLGTSQIALQIGFERRSSNLTQKSWNQWTVGPLLTASWRF
jgi:hypothetical protein